VTTDKEKNKKKILIVDDEPDVLFDTKVGFRR
jgi:hypothetical protein